MFGRSEREPGEFTQRQLVETQMSHVRTVGTMGEDIFNAKEWDFLS